VNSAGTRACAPRGSKSKEFGGAGQKMSGWGGLVENQ
jgi:hypothetical protein